jgi:drug/metabolite transporter superfamily protein YnfA
LISWTINFDLAAFGRGYPAQGNVMVLSSLIFSQLDGIQTLHVIDSGKLSILGTHNGHIGLNLVGIGHSFSPVGSVGSNLIDNF